MTVYKGIGMIVIVIFDLSCNGIVTRHIRENDVPTAIASFSLSLCLIL